MVTCTTAPDPDPRTPKFRCPPGTIDSHIHLFGPPIGIPTIPRDTLPRLVWAPDWPHVNLEGRGMPNDGDLVDDPRALYSFPSVA